jgi:hypothetical protein
MLTKSGFLSQFVNFNTHSHDQPRDEKRCSIILQGVARQMLQKIGTRLWWVTIPQSSPTPTVFIGVDVLHAPRVYDPVAHKRVAKASCAAIFVQVFRDPVGEMKPMVIVTRSNEMTSESTRKHMQEPSILNMCWGTTWTIEEEHIEKSVVFNTKL